MWRHIGNIKIWKWMKLESNGERMEDDIGSVSLFSRLRQAMSTLLHHRFPRECCNTHENITRANGSQKWFFKIWIRTACIVRYGVPPKGAQTPKTKNNPSLWLKNTKPSFYSKEDFPKWQVKNFRCTKCSKRK